MGERVSFQAKANSFIHVRYPCLSVSSTQMVILPRPGGGKGRRSSYYSPLQHPSYPPIFHRSCNQKCVPHTESGSTSVSNHCVLFLLIDMHSFMRSIHALFSFICRTHACAIFVHYALQSSMHLFTRCIYSCAASCRFYSD